MMSPVVLVPVILVVFIISITIAGKRRIHIDLSLGGDNTSPDKAIKVDKFSDLYVTVSGADGQYVALGWGKQAYMSFNPCMTMKTNTPQVAGLHCLVIQVGPFNYRFYYDVE